jgi:hypothetical protein
MAQVRRSSDADTRVALPPAASRRSKADMLIIPLLWALGGEPTQVETDTIPAGRGETLLIDKSLPVVV